MSNQLHALLCAAVLIALNGCGIKGDLYLPQPLPAEQTSNPQNNS